MCSEQRRLREEAKEEMERRAKLARNEGNNRAYEDAMNMIDAIAAGEDLNTMLKIGESMFHAQKSGLFFHL